MSEIKPVRRRRIVIATDNFLPRWDGIARFLVEIILRLKKNYDITILTSNFEGHYDDPSIKIIRFPLRSFHFGDFPPAKPDRRIMKKEILYADIVWVQTIGPIGSLAIKIAKSFKKKVVAYNHSIEWELVPNAIGPYFLKKIIYSITKRFARRLYNKCDVLFVPTKEVSEKLSNYGIKKEKIVIPLGVDSRVFAPPKSKAEAKVKIGIDPKNYVIGYVGRIGKEKNLKTLLRAFIWVKKKHENVRLLIVGGGVESIKNMLSSKPGVIVTGPKDDVSTYLQAMDAYVLPSLTETTSLSTLEAMSCELPVIVTKVGLPKEYIKNDYNGFLIDKKDAYAVYRHITELLKEPSLGARLGKKARQTVIEGYSWDKTAARIEEEIEKILHPK